ncbi:hypothetical protein THTE_3121 [Thermogutta terrifontis]|uniref:Uncharacterized protein n=1 Tax=Thermogutta terrifontis TaxID=1331910 RepID=A0A286RID1_9BACT|nr:hypothetical protein THTE_3121 [Thermogutta terrifontis]
MGRQPTVWSGKPSFIPVENPSEGLKIGLNSRALVRLK